MTVQNEEIISTPEAMKLLGGISRQTLYARIREGEIKPLPKAPGNKRNPALKFRRAEIEAYVRANSEAPA